MDLFVGVYGPHRLLISEMACGILSAVDVEWAFDTPVLQTHCFIRRSLHASQHEDQFDLSRNSISQLYMTTLNKMYSCGFNCAE